MMIIGDGGCRVVLWTVGTLKGAANLANVEVVQRPGFPQVSALHSPLRVLPSIQPVLNRRVGHGVPALSAEREASFHLGHLQRTTT